MLVIARGVTALVLLTAFEARDQAVPSSSLDLHLICQGVRIDTEEQTTSASVSRDFHPTESASGEATTTRRVRVPGQIDVSVQGDLVRVNPSSVLHSTSLFRTSADGWYTLTHVVIDADQIGGKFKLSPVQNPNVRIDRHTGAIRMRGFGFNYSGTCERSTLPISSQKF